jgi:hypothetical protein
MRDAEFLLDHGKQQNEASQESNGEPPPKKPGSKEKGRKRTKTGCLSKWL